MIKTTPFFFACLMAWFGCATSSTPSPSAFSAPNKPMETATVTPEPTAANNGESDDATSNEILQTNINETDENTPQTYQILLARLKQGDTSIDFSALRNAFVQTDQYDPYQDDFSDETNSMLKALDEKQFEEAIRIAGQLLDTNYTAMLPHIISAIAWNELGNSEKERFHGEIVKGLVRSLMESGDGSIEKPYRVIRVQEEYDLINVMGLEFKSQSLLSSEDMMIDKLTAVDSVSGETKSIHFNVDACFSFWKKQIPESESGSEVTQ